MRCITPIQVGKNKVPCGKCNFCLQVKRADWSFRLSQELRVSNSARFVTLTYEDNKMPYATVELGDVLADVPSLCKRDVQLFFKRLRKECGESKIRHYTVGEYGTRTFRPHYHSIVFGVPGKVVNDLPGIWNNGHVHVGGVTPASIHYVTKYVINRHGDVGGREPPFSLMSRKPGIGAKYLDTHTGWHRAAMRNYTQVNGVLGRLPRYYKDRIFDEDERAKLAVESMSENIDRFYEELDRIRQFCDDPYSHYVERVMAEHDSITSKINSKDKF